MYPTILDGAFNIVGFQPVGCICPACWTMLDDVGKEKKCWMKFLNWIKNIIQHSNVGIMLDVCCIRLSTTFYLTFFLTFDFFFTFFFDFLLFFYFCADLLIFCLMSIFYFVKILDIFCVL